MMTKLGVHILPLAFPWTLAMIRKVATILGPAALASLIRIALLVYEQQKEKVMETKTSWWYLKIDDYPNYKPNDADLEHIAECIKQGYDNGELIQEAEDEDQE